jgi:hypothetical protein
VPDVLVPALVRALVEPHHLGQLAGGQEGVHFELAPAAGEVTMLSTADVLIAEPEHLPFEQRPIELGEQLIVDRWLR